VDIPTKELVAIGASVAGRCRPCFRHHLSVARELGISDDDIRSVIALAKKISENGNERMFEFAEKTMAEGKTD